MARWTRRLREEQEARNAAAVQEVERRRTEAEAEADLSPGERRRRMLRARSQARAAHEEHVVVARKASVSGVKMLHTPAAQDDKRMPAEATDDKAVLTSVASPPLGPGDVAHTARWASQQAQSLAERWWGANALEVAGEFVPSSRHGYTVQDVREIKQTLDLEDAEAIGD
jgi:hypothetical protein